jgi:hypothetical protein
MGRRLPHAKSYWIAMASNGLTGQTGSASSRTPAFSLPLEASTKEDL